MHSTILFITLLFTAISTSQVNQQPIQKDPADKVLLATDTIALRPVKNLEKENSEAVKTQDHPKITRKKETAKKKKPVE